MPTDDKNDLSQAKPQSFASSKDLESFILGDEDAVVLAEEDQNRLQSTLDSLLDDDSDYSEADLEKLQKEFININNPNLLKDLDSSMDVSVSGGGMSELDALLSDMDDDLDDFGDIPSYISNTSFYDPELEREKAEKLAAQEALGESEEASEFAMFNSADEFEADEVIQTKGKRRRIVTKIKKQSKYRKPIMAAVLSGVAVLLITVLLLTIIGPGEVPSERRVYETYVRFNENFSNNSNFVFFEGDNVTVALGERYVTVTKAQFDSMSTAFFLRTDDTSRLTFRLLDEKGYEYGKFDPLMLHPDSLHRMFDDDRTLRVSFEPFDTIPTRFRLYIDDDMNNHAEFSFFVPELTAVPRARYSTGVTAVSFPDRSFTNINLIGASFTSNLSSINISVETSSQHRYVKLPDENLESVIRLEHKGRSIASIGNVSVEDFPFENHTSFRADFYPLTDLTGNVSVTLSGLRMHYNISQRFTAPELIPDTRQGDFTVDRIIELDNYRLILERLGRQGNLFILVSHTIDNDALAISGPQATDTNRVHTRLGAELVFNEGTANEVRIEGVCLSGPIGMDVLFSLRGFEEAKQHELVQTPLSNISIIIHSVDFMLENITVDIDLAKGTVSEPPAVQTQLQQIARSLRTDINSYVNIVSYYVDGDNLHAVIRVTDRVFGNVFEYTDHSVRAVIGRDGYVLLNSVIN
jgi:hypothetical protein